MYAVVEGQDTRPGGSESTSGAVPRGPTLELRLLPVYAAARVVGLLSVAAPYRAGGTQT